MAEYNVRINVKNDTGYDQLYPESKSDIVNFDKTNSNLSSTNVEAAIKEVNTKANTNKTNIGTLSSLTTDSKTNLVGAINEVDSHANSAQTTANSANSTANTNKTNIGTLSSLKTAIKTSIVNAINSLYDNTIGKTLKTLEEVKLVTEEGFYVDALAIKEISNKTVKFYSNFESDTIKINAPFDCSVQIIHTFFGWGYAGNLYVFTIKSNTENITRKCENFGGCEGGDTVNKYLRADAIFTGLKSGEEYTFQREEITSYPGATNNRRWTVICYPE